MVYWGAIYRDTEKGDGVRRFMGSDFENSESEIDGGLIVGKTTSGMSCMGD